jgi:uncharacterized protein (DUF58 family)
MIVPTPRCAILVASSIPIAGVIVTAFPESSVASLYLPLLAMFLCLYDLFTIPNSKIIDITFDIPSFLYVGDTFKLQITVKTPEKSKVFKIKLFLETMGDTNILPLSEIEVKNGMGTGFIPITPKKRGRLKIKNLWMAFRGPLEFLEARKKIPHNKIVDITQNVKGLHAEALEFFTKDISTGQKLQPLKGAGSEFESLTDYTIGMDNRFIDWKRSARHHKLLAKEFRPEKNNQIILGFDTGRLMTEPIAGRPRLDHFVRAGLMLGWVSLRAGDLVGSCGFDFVFRNFLAPGRTPSFFLKLQRFTSNLSYQTTETNFTLSLTELAGKLRHRALIVLFTEFGDSVSASLLLECLELLTKKHVVIFVSIPDPISSYLPKVYPQDFSKMAEAVIADNFRKERAIVLERMNRLGVYSLDIEWNKLGASLINRYLTIKRRGTL